MKEAGSQEKYKPVNFNWIPELEGVESAGKYLDARG